MGLGGGRTERLLLVGRRALVRGRVLSEDTAAPRSNKEGVTDHPTLKEEVALVRYVATSLVAGILMLAVLATGGLPANAQSSEAGPVRRRWLTKILRGPGP